MSRFVFVMSTDSAIEILWDVAVATFVIHLAVIYFLATLTSGLGLCYLAHYARLLPSNPLAVSAAAALGAIAGSARLVIARYKVPRTAGVRLATGGVALALMVAMQTLTGLALYEGGLGGWVAASAGPMAWPLSAGLLVAYALMPALMMVFEGRAEEGGEVWHSWEEKLASGVM